MLDDRVKPGVIYILNWSTESSDCGVDGYWTTKPSDEELGSYLKERFPDDYEAETLCYSWDELEPINQEKVMTEGQAIIELAQGMSNLEKLRMKRLLEDLVNTIELSDLPDAKHFRKCRAYKEAVKSLAEMNRHE